MRLGNKRINPALVGKIERADSDSSTMIDAQIKPRNVDPESPRKHLGTIDIPRLKAKNTDKQAKIGKYDCRLTSRVPEEYL